MYEECRHIKTSGTKCGAAALKGKAYCYFHFRAHQLRHHAAGPFQPNYNTARFKTPLLEDCGSIQLVISEIVSALAEDRIDLKRAGRILYGIQLATSNAKHEDDIIADKPVRELFQNEEGEDIASEATALDEEDEQEDELEVGENEEGHLEADLEAPSEADDLVDDDE